MVEASPSSLSPGRPLTAVDTPTMLRSPFLTAVASLPNLPSRRLSEAQADASRRRSPNLARSEASFGPGISTYGTFASFRQVGYDQLVMPGSPPVAPTLVDPHEHRAPQSDVNPKDRLKQMMPNPRAASIVGHPTTQHAVIVPVDPHASRTQVAKPTEECCKALQLPPGAYIKLCVKANTVSIHNMGLSPSLSTLSPQEDQKITIGKRVPSHSLTEQLAHQHPLRPYAVIPPGQQSPCAPAASFGDGMLSENFPGLPGSGMTYDERRLYPPSPQVYPVAGIRPKHANISVQHPTPPSTVPPEFKEPGQLQSGSRHGAGPELVTTRVVYRDVEQTLEKSPIQTLSLKPTVCEKGEDCTCENGPNSIDLLKDAAAYLIRTFNAFRQDIYILHTQTLATLDDLSCGNVMSGTNALPNTVLQILETEAAQLVQDWHNAEAQCTQYICDCILADVNGADESHASDAIAKSAAADAPLVNKGDVQADIATEPVINVVAEMDAAIRPEDSVAEHDSQCIKNFEKINGVLIALTRQSERLKKQWINLLDLCATLRQSAHN